MGEGVWVARRTPLCPGFSEQVTITERARALSFGEVIKAWRCCAAFRAFFITELAATEFPAFFWETPPIRQRRVDIGYEHVAIRSDELACRPADVRAFESRFKETGFTRTVASFRNLGGDALLVAPLPIEGIQAYAHIGAFVRLAPDHQRHALFQTLGRAIAHGVRTCEGGLWTSTSGLGVPWVHIRLDSVPKYYNYRPFAER